MNTPTFNAEACLQERGRSRTLNAVSFASPNHVVTQMISGGGFRPGGGLGFNCMGGVCVCSGDDDCNGMFTVACGPGPAKCWVRGPGGRSVFCICSR